MKDIFHSQRLLANLILKSHKFLVLFVIKRSVLEILHRNLSTHPRVCLPLIAVWDVGVVDF